MNRIEQCRKLGKKNIKLMYKKFIKSRYLIERKTVVPNINNNYNNQFDEYRNGKNYEIQQILKKKLMSFHNGRQKQNQTNVLLVK